METVKTLRKKAAEFSRKIRRIDNIRKKLQDGIKRAVIFGNNKNTERCIYHLSVIFVLALTYFSSPSPGKYRRHR